MRRATWAAVVAVFVGVSAQAFAQDDAGAAEAADAGTAAPTEGTQPTPPPPISAEAAAIGQADTPPPPAGGLHADLLGANIPLRFTLNGYYRARFDYINNVPTARLSTPTDPAADAAFAYMRLRLEPTIAYGSNAETPIAALHAQFDILDNVVFGDNARLTSTPIFAEGPSATGITGTDNNYFFVRRLWLEFLTPIGVIRVGRQASHGGMGLLFNDGNGFRNDWGDANGGSTFDRVLFATRPLTIYNTLTRGDSRPTPLIAAVGYDFLITDPLGVLTTPESRPTAPFEFLTHGQDSVGQGLVVLAWNDPKINPNRLSDELSLGLIGVNRVQGSTQSNVFIYDAFWRFRYSFFGNRGVQLFTNGEIYTIQGQTRGIDGLKSVTQDTRPYLDAAMTMPNPSYGLSDKPIHANIWGGVAQIGVAMDNKWQLMVEAGYSPGDAHVFGNMDRSRTLAQRAFSPDYHVGLLMFSTAVAARSANSYIGALSALQSNGGVWNASYLYPQLRYRVFNGVDVLAAFLLAWADQLNDAYTTAGATGTQAYCGPAGSQRNNCFLGWELDLGLKVSWGPNDLMRWSNEFGWMEAGEALGPELAKQFLWTFQTRFAMSF